MRALLLLLPGLLVAPAAAFPGGPALRADLHDGAGQAYPPYMEREWDLALPETGAWDAGLPLPWFVHHPQRPMLPTGDACFVDTARAHWLRLRGLDPGEPYRVLLWYGVGAGGLSASWGYHDLGRVHAMRDGTGALRIDLGHHRPDANLSAFLIVWQPSPQGYWSAEFGWPATGESGEPGCAT